MTIKNWIENITQEAKTTYKQTAIQIWNRNEWSHYEAHIHDVFSRRFAVIGVKVIIYDVHVTSASVYALFTFFTVC